MWGGSARESNCYISMRLWVQISSRHRKSLVRPHTYTLVTPHCSGGGDRRMAGPWDANLTSCSVTSSQWKKIVGDGVRQLVSSFGHSRPAHTCGYTTQTLKYRSTHNALLWWLTVWVWHAAWKESVQVTGDIRHQPTLFTSYERRLWHQCQGNQDTVSAADKCLYPSNDEQRPFLNSHCKHSLCHDERQTDVSQRNFTFMIHFCHEV